jgi:hypothetical protein
VVLSEIDVHSSAFRFRIMVVFGGYRWPYGDEHIANLSLRVVMVCLMGTDLKNVTESTSSGSVKSIKQSKAREMGYSFRVPQQFCYSAVKLLNTTRPNQNLSC